MLRRRRDHTKAIGLVLVLIGSRVRQGKSIPGVQQSVGMSGNLCAQDTTATGKIYTSEQSKG